MWFDGQRQPNTLYVANTSRGKDSTAMLRAIELMGWPLDMICSVDIWFDETTPAELPPMVAFKDEYDRKVLDWFGISVTRLCATKRERESRNQTESVTHDASHTAKCSTTKRSEGIMSEKSADSQRPSERGARNSNMKRLTYCDIFYRKVSPRRERERERVSMRQELERQYPNLRIPDAKRELVQRPQTLGTLGFPNQSCRWCTGELKQAPAMAFRRDIARGVRPTSKLLPLISP